MISQIKELDTWLKSYRVDYYSKLNPPASKENLEKLEEEINAKLPEEFKTLLEWRNGQSSDAMDTLHPITNEMFMCIDEIKYWYKELKELLHYGDIELDIWKPTWLPFMSNGGGDHTCIDFSPENFGAIISHNHEEPDGRKINNSIAEWVAELNMEFNKLDFENWDFEKCQ